MQRGMDVANAFPAEGAREVPEATVDHTEASSKKASPIGMPLQGGVL